MIKNIYKVNWKQNNNNSINWINQIKHYYLNILASNKIMVNCGTNQIRNKKLYFSEIILLSKKLIK